MVQKEIDISIGIDALIENGFFYLEEHQWKRAEEYFEKAIEISPRNPYPYIGKLLVTHKLPTMDSLPECPIDFRKTNNFKTALRYADKNLNAKLQGYMEQYKVKFEEMYQAACMKLSLAQSLEDYEKCYKLFIEFGDYKDATSLAQKTNEMIKQEEYKRCEEKLKQNIAEDDYKQLYDTLSNIDYKDSAELASFCRTKYFSLKYQREDAERKEKIYKSAISQLHCAKSVNEYIDIRKALLSIAGYKDSQTLIEQCDEQINQRRATLFFIETWNKCIAFIKRFSNSFIAMLYLAVALNLVFIFALIDHPVQYIVTLLISLGVGIGITIKNKKGIRAIGKVLVVAVLITALLTAILPIDSILSTHRPDDDGWTQCYNCDTTGKVRNSLGYYVDCPRCDGLGWIPD
jgi:hypothetical protein